MQLFRQKKTSHTSINWEIRSTDSVRSYKSLQLYFCNNKTKYVGCNTTKYTKRKKISEIIFCTTSAHIHLATTKYRLKTESIALRPQRGSSILVGPSGMKEIDVCCALLWFCMPLLMYWKTNRESSLLLFGLFSLSTFRTNRMDFNTLEKWKEIDGILLRPCSVCWPVHGEIVVIVVWVLCVKDMIDVEMYLWILLYSYPFHSFDIANGLVFTFGRIRCVEYSFIEWILDLREYDDDIWCWWG